MIMMFIFFFFSSRRRHTRFDCDWSSDVCSSDLATQRILQHIWEYGGKFPDVLQDPLRGESARSLYKDAQEMLATILREHRSEERRVGKSVDLGGRRRMKKKKSREQRERE